MIRQEIIVIRTIPYQLPNNRYNTLIDLEATVKCHLHGRSLCFKTGYICLSLANLKLELHVTCMWYLSNFNSHMFPEYTTYYYSYGR